MLELAPWPTGHEGVLVTDFGKSSGAASCERRRRRSAAEDGGNNMNYRAYNLELIAIVKSVPDDEKDSFANRFNSQAKNPTVIFGLSIYLGSLGIDRFVLGHTLLGILKLITLGGLGIWTIVDWFLVAGIAREKNIELARSIAKTS
jgi:TM2 domain-containing membrane protein YozV